MTEALIMEDAGIPFDLIKIQGAAGNRIVDRETTIDAAVMAFVG